MGFSSGLIFITPILFRTPKLTVMTRSLIIAILVMLTLSCSSNREKESEPVMSEQDQHMEWWREARFGLFIHWGLYAQPAGVWKGEEIPGISEWIMAHAKIPVNPC